MQTNHRIVIALGLCLAAALLAGCQGEDPDREFEYLPIYGDGNDDPSPVVAVVDGLPITEFDMQLRMDELSRGQRGRYTGPEGQRLLLKSMIDDVLFVQGAVENELYNEQAVARTLITDRRIALITAMKNLYLLKDREPDEDAMQEYFLANRDQFRQQGAVQARHIELTSEEDARRAYERIMTDDYNHRFEMVCKEMSVNEETKAEDGELGWFNRGGYAEHVADYEEFTTKAYDLGRGLHPPFQVGDRWHVVEIRQREPERSMTFQEARPQIVNILRPVLQKEVVEEFLRQARAKSEIELKGPFAPGAGLQPEQLLARARAMADFSRKLELFDLLVSDFPQSDRADDALFLAANAALDSYGDTRMARNYLTRLLREYPDSELVQDTQFLLENLDNPQALRPSSIEELRK